MSILIQSILIKFLAILLTLYIACIIVFFQNYINITYIVNFMLISTYTILMLVNREKKYKVNKIINIYALFIVLGLASSFWAIDSYEASFRTLQLFLILINMFIMYNLSNKYHMQYTFLNGILLASLINYLIVLGIVQVPFEIILPGGGMRFMGTLGNPNVLAIVMLISILASSIYLNNKDKINKILYYYQYINITLALYIIVLSVSKKGIIAGSLFVLFFIVFSMKNLQGIIRLGTLFVLGLVLLFYFIDMNYVFEHYERVMIRFNSAIDAGTGTGISSSTEIRKNLILSGLDVIQERPLFGYGLANFRFVSFNGQYAHNNYIEVFANVGFIGGIIFYAMYFYVIQTVIRMINKNLKYIFLFFLIVFLVMDLAVVSYNSKHLLFTLLFIYIFAEKDSKYRKERVNG